MTWQMLAASSVIMFTTLNLVQRVIAVESKNQRAMAVLFNLIAGLIATIIFFATNSHKSFVLPTDRTAYIALGAAIFFYGMFERGRFYAAKLLEASVLTTITNVSVVVAFVGAVFLYSETVTINKLLGSIFILVALLLVSYNKTSTKASRAGVGIGIVISLMLGLGWMLDKMGAEHFNAATYSILIWTIPIILIYLPYVSLKDIKTEFVNSSWKVCLIALLNVVGYLLQLKALEVADATQVIPLVQTSTLFTILLGTLFLKERDRILIKVFAGLLAICGSVMLLH